jgi:hypothetical protein
MAKVIGLFLKLQLIVMLSTVERFRRYKNNVDGVRDSCGDLDTRLQGQHLHFIGRRIHLRLVESLGASRAKDRVLPPVYMAFICRSSTKNSFVTRSCKSFVADQTSLGLFPAAIILTLLSAVYKTLVCLFPAVCRCAEKA